MARLAALFSLLLAATPSLVLARGGFGSAIGSMVVNLLGAAVVFGVLSGFALGSTGVRPRFGIAVAVTAVIGSLLFFAIMAQWFSLGWSIPLFIAIPPLVVLLVVFRITWGIGAPGGVIAVVPTAPPATPRLSSLGAWLAATYLFWAVFSLVNLKFLAGLTIPLLLPWGAYEKFLPFLLPPLVFAVLAAALATLAILRIWRSRGRFAAPFLFNAILLVAFLVAAELYKNHLIATALKDRKPDCVIVNSFLRSLGAAGADFQFFAHATFDEDGKTYFWSYRGRGFFEGRERLNVNFSCRAAVGSS